jgi:hypothetical protein
MNDFIPENLPSERDALQGMPKLAVDFLQAKCGPEIQAEAALQMEVARGLKKVVIERAKEGPSKEVLEALAFANILGEMATIASSGDLAPDWGKRLNLEPNMGMKLVPDCAGWCQTFVNEVKEIDFGQSQLNQAEIVNFVHAPCRLASDGLSQNLVFLQFRTPSGLHYYMVDAAAYYFRPLWVKALTGQTKREVFQKAKTWLDEAFSEDADWLTGELVEKGNPK